MPCRLAASVAWQVIDDEGVVVDLDRGRSLGLNPSGAFILSLLETHDAEAIAAELNRRFQVDLAQARADVAAFVEELRRRGLVVAA